MKDKETSGDHQRVRPVLIARSIGKCSCVGTPKVSVTIVQVSSSGEGDDANTVTNTYTEESESPNTHVTGEISGE